MINAGLILEGGGMRGAYTCGVLDYLMDAGMQFQHVYGVSAGCCHACSYLSGQRGRAIKTVVDYGSDPRYGSKRNLLKTGDYFDPDFVFGQLPDHLLPYDYDAFRTSGSHLYAVVTNCKTGQAEYLPVREMRRDTVAVRASSSLPLLARMVEIGGNYYLDGGVADSIPLAHSMAKGNTKHLVVLTQHKGYKKKPSRLYPAIRAKYGRWPKLVEASKTRYIRYNEALRLVEQEEGEGRAVVLQPRKPVTIGRLETNREMLMDLYRQGYRDAKEREDTLNKF